MMSVHVMDDWTGVSMDLGSAVLSILRTVYEVIGPEGVLRFLMAHNDRERIQFILDAEYDAADAAANKAEEEKLGR